MTQLFTNNADSTLAAGISAAALSMTVQAGEGALFPNPGAGEFFLVTLFKVSGISENSWEVVKVTARSTDVFTIVRAQEGTTATAFDADDSVSLRLTAGGAAGMLQAANDLDDLASASTARTNLGLGTAAVADATDFATAAQGATADSALQAADNLSDVASPSAARSSLGLGSAALLASSAVLQTANNLSEVTAATARGNLGLGTAAVLASSAVLQTANNLSELTGTAATARTNLGLGTAATHADGDYATAAQGTKADSALQADGSVTATATQPTTIAGGAGFHLDRFASWKCSNGNADNRTWVWGAEKDGAQDYLYLGLAEDSGLIGTEAITIRGTGAVLDTFEISNGRLICGGVTDDGLSDIQGSFIAGLVIAAAGGVETPSITMTGSGATILGDFSNASVSNRAMFRSSTTNGATSVGAVPNGTSVISAFTVFGSNDPDNTHYGMLVTNLVANTIDIQSGKTGTGTTRPVVFAFDGVEKARIGITGDMTIVGSLDVGVKIRATGNAAPATGAGIEIGYVAPTGFLLAYDRGAGAYKSFQMDGSDHSFAISGVTKVSIDTSGNLKGFAKINAVTGYQFNGTEVVGSRKTGWGAPTGTPTRTAFATSSVTTAQLAERVKALIDDLTTHGLIGA